MSAWTTRCTGLVRIPDRLRATAAQVRVLHELNLRAAPTAKPYPQLVQRTSFLVGRTKCPLTRAVPANI